MNIERIASAIGAVDRAMEAATILRGNLPDDGMLRALRVAREVLGHAQQCIVGVSDMRMIPIDQRDAAVAASIAALASGILGFPIDVSVKAPPAPVLAANDAANAMQG